jgi:hypothetical protein
MYLTPVVLPHPLEAVEHKAYRNVQEEVLLEMGLDLVDGQVVADKKVDDLLSHPAGIAALEAGALNYSREVLGAGATGGVDTVDRGPEGGTLMNQVTHLAAPRSLATAPGATVRTTMTDRRPLLRLIERFRFARRTPRRTVSPHPPLLLLEQEQDERDAVDPLE